MPTLCSDREGTVAEWSQILFHGCAVQPARSTEGQLCPLLEHLTSYLGYITCGLVFQLGKINKYWASWRGGGVGSPMSLGAWEQDENFESLLLSSSKPVPQAHDWEWRMKSRASTPEDALDKQ